MFDTYFKVSRGYLLFSLIGGRRPSCIASSSGSLATSRSFRCGGLRLRPCFASVALRAGGERRFVGGSSPNPARRLPSSASWASILAFTSSAWSAIRCEELLSNSFCRRQTWLLRSRFSESSRAYSFSSSLIRCDCLELSLAISRFCRRNFRRTGEDIRVSCIN